MFFLVDEEEDVVYYKKEVYEDLKKQTAGEKDNAVLNTPSKFLSQLMISLNWFVGVAFMSSFSYCVAHYHPDVPGTLPRGSFVVALLSLSYLLAHFGVNATMGNLVPCVPIKSLHSTTFSGQKEEFQAANDDEYHKVESPDSSGTSVVKKKGVVSYSHSLAWVSLLALAVTCPFLFNLAFKSPSVKKRYILPCHCDR